MAIRHLLSGLLTGPSRAVGFLRRRRKRQPDPCQGEEQLEEGQETQLNARVEEVFGAISDGEGEDDAAEEKREEEKQPNLAD